MKIDYSLKIKKYQLSCGKLDRQWENRQQICTGVHKMVEAVRRAVYIEDEPEMIDLVRLILARKRYDVIGAHGGQEGLDTVRKNKPDVVLLDLMMPDMDGWEVFHQLKGDRETKDIPVIIITAKAQNIDKILALHIAKVDDYIAKPFTPQELFDSLTKVLLERQPDL
jgi:DNA-binding response OmpR family regulator